MSALIALTLAGSLAIGASLSPALPNQAVLLALVLLFAIPVSELAVALVNALILFAFPPRLMPRLDFEEAIPEQHRTLVVVPSLLDNETTLQALLDELEVRSLANPEENLHFALLTDFVDADREDDTEQERRLLESAEAGIAQLNERFGPGKARYFLLHRRRKWNPSEGRFMGWERKRGKLEELNRLLRGAADTSFTTVTAPLGLLASVRYVITLDADTELPRGVARRLVGAMAHPQNRPVLDPTRQRVVRGYSRAWARCP